MAVQVIADGLLKFVIWRRLLEPLAQVTFQILVQLVSCGTKKGIRYKRYKTYTTKHKDRQQDSLTCMQFKGCDLENDPICMGVKCKINFRANPSALSRLFLSLHAQEGYLDTRVKLC